MIVKVIDSHRFEVELLFDEVDLQVVHFVIPLENPLNIVDVDLELLPDVINVHMLKLNIRSTEAL